MEEEIEEDRIEEGEGGEGELCCIDGCAAAARERELRGRELEGARGEGARILCAREGGKEGIPLGEDGKRSRRADVFFEDFRGLASLWVWAGAHWLRGGPCPRLEGALAIVACAAAQREDQTAVGIYHGECILFSCNIACVSINRVIHLTLCTPMVFRVKSIMRLGLLLVAMNSKVLENLVSAANLGNH